MSFPFNNGDGITKGKGITALRNSKAGRNELVAMFGGVENLPSSVMRAVRPRGIDESQDEPTSKRSYDLTSPGREKARAKDGMVAEAYYISGRGCQAGALSTFPQNIGRSMVLLYSEPGDTIFDPFAGHNSRAELVVRAGRNYIGCDISHEFMEFNCKRAAQLRQEFPGIKIELYEGDSRKIPVASKTGDMSITSPPYWQQEFYGDEPEQLYNCETYRDFLDNLQLVMNENYRILKPGAYALWFINDFVQKGKFHSYHMDVARLGRKAGFTLHDLLVVDLGNSIRDCFTNQIIKTRRLPKRHEFGLVFKKIKQAKAR